MGIDRTTLSILCESRQYVTNGGNVLTLGRQQNNTPNNENMDIAQLYKVDISQLILKDYCEAFLKDLLGASTVESVDASDYEGATHVYNLNMPVPNNFKNKYDYIFDGGTTEHIFNIAQLFDNIIDMLHVNGLFVSATCNNNFSGHGMYQFSPELYLSMFNKTYGMEILALKLGVIGSTGPAFIDVNSYNGSRNETKFYTNDPVYILVIARKISDTRQYLTINPPNQYSYEQIDWVK